MAQGPQHTVNFRRRRTDRTDYAQRLELLKSGKPRAVIRLTNNQTLVQIITYHEDGDQTQAAYTANQLPALDWEHHTGNLPAAYLTGYACGVNAVANGFDEAVADLGLHNIHPGSRLFAAVKGLQDAGVHVPADPDVLPAESRLTGEHIDASLPDHVNTVKQRIDDEVPQ